MIEEIQKRPFARPLFIWILGIGLQMVFPGYGSGVVCLLLTGCYLVAAGFVSRSEEEIYVYYDARWVWGMTFVLLLLSLASWTTLVVDQREEVEIATLFPAAERIQRRCVDRLDALCLSDEEKAVLASITVGYRKEMSREMNRDFSITGVTHVLSVSGFHVAVVCGFVSFLLQGLPKTKVWSWVRYVLSMVLLWVYVCITGMSPPAVRSGVMLSIYLTGRVIRRDSDGYNTWAASAFCMLVYNPFYLFDIGFQLSYLAVLSILYFQPRLKEWIEVRNPLLSNPWEWITVTVSAQIGTALLCLYYFGRFSLVFLFTNLPLTFISLLLIPASLLWLLCPEWMPGAGYLQFGVESLTRGMLRVVELFSSVPGASYSGKFGLLSLIAGYAMLAYFMLYAARRRPYQLLTALSFLLVLLLLQLFSRSYPSLILHCQLPIVNLIVPLAL